MKLEITITPDLKEIQVKAYGLVKNRRGLNAALATRLADVLVGHFHKRNSEPNKMGAPKTNFWNQVAAATGVTEITEDGATVTVAEQRFNIHLYGGTVRPTGGRKFLTLPQIPAARGLNARSYERMTGRKLFIVPGRRALFERVQAGATESLTRNTSVTIRDRQGGNALVRLRARTTIRPVYSLVVSATIKRDPRALPPIIDIQAELLEEAQDFTDREASKA